jgi:4-hydroxy-tetrahydrodipicolinate reductase
MGTITILGDGHLGQAIAAALAARGDRARLAGRPDNGGTHPRASFDGADVVVDASRGDAVLGNLRAATAGGVRRFVIASTGWGADADDVAATLSRGRSVAVAAPNLALGAAVFLRLVEHAARLAAATGGFDASVVEWHRRAKLDRPSGTAREIVRRLSGSFPIDVDEVAVVRSGWMPGHHEVVLDRESETIELRLTARDRSGYAAGALAAIDWLRGAPRSVGLHPFDEVVDEILAIPDRSTEVVAMPR